MDKQKRTIHTARTMMYEELAKVIYGSDNKENFLESLNRNAANKKTSKNQIMTNAALISLYNLNAEYIPFKCFIHFWGLCNEEELPTLTLLYAIANDYLLKESIDVINSIAIGEKVDKLLLEENIKQYHNNRFSPKTISSTARNILSSWKQAGYISKDKKAIRINKNITYKLAAFSLLMAYLNNDRGYFILNSKFVKALAIGEDKVKELAFEASKRDILKFQNIGSVLVITFNSLFNRLNIYE